MNEIAIPDNCTVTDIDSISAEKNIKEVFVLVRGDVVIGFVILLPITSDCIELKRLYLKSSERGRKLGEFLLKYAINIAGKNNFKSIRLETTSKFKEAVSLYKKYGFTVLKEVEKAPGHDLAFEKSIQFYHQL